MNLLVFLFDILYSINIGNKLISRCVLSLYYIGYLWESEVMFMEFILFLIYGFMISTTLNITLLTIIYIIWTNKE